VRNLNITIPQTALTWQDPAANRTAFEALIEPLAAQTDLVILPEMFTTGFTMDAAGNAEPPDGPTVQWMERIAADFETAVCGSLIVADNGQYFNRLIWAAPGTQPASYDKRHLFRMAGEHEHYAPGQQRSIFQIGDWRILPLVCYDLRFPVWSRGRNEFDLLIYVANWPASRRSAWQVLLPARAVENQCYVAGVNRIGIDGNGVEYAGDSVVADYFGTTLADCGSEPDTVSVTLNLEKLHRYRDKFPAWKDADDYEIR